MQQAQRCPLARRRLAVIRTGGGGWLASGGASPNAGTRRADRGRINETNYGSCLCAANGRGDDESVFLLLRAQEHDRAPRTICQRGTRRDGSAAVIAQEAVSVSRDRKAILLSLQPFALSIRPESVVSRTTRHVLHRRRQTAATTGAVPHQSVSPQLRETKKSNSELVWHLASELENNVS